MTQSNDPGSPKTPGFGAFIGSPTNDNPTRVTHEVTAESTREEPQRSRKRPSEEGGAGARGRRPRRRAAVQVDETSSPSQEDGRNTESSASSRGGGSPGRGRGSRSRGSRGGRGRGTDTPEEADASAPATKEGTETEPARGRRKRSSRGGRGRSKKVAAEATDDGARAPEGADSAEAGPKPTRSRRKRGTRSSSREAAEGDAGGGSASDTEREGEKAGGDEKPKRRRRGTRGGRGRSKKVAGRREPSGPAVVEIIPGEEDDLPELPELPEEAELIEDGELGQESGRGGKKKRSRRKRGSSREDEPTTKGTVQRGARKKSELTPDRKILVNACDQQEMRVAVVRDGTILDFQMNVDSDTSLVNDIYRGRIVNIEASIGAAFVDFGRGRNGFLHTSDVLPTYAEEGASLKKLLTTSIDPEDWDASSSQPGVSLELSEEDESEEASGDEGDETKSKGTKKTSRRTTKKSGSKDGGKGARGKGRQRSFRARPRRPINQLLKVGQNVVVQITKDAIGDKGPTLTTYLSIPGRYLVLMPSISHRGVSRKIEDSKERKRLLKILKDFDVPDSMGIIARTATKDCTKAEIKRDLDYLLSAWNRLAKHLDRGRGPAALYQESDVAIRTVRDLYGPETESVIIDDHETFLNIREFAEQLMPDQIDRIVEHDGSRPLFHSLGVEQDFEKIFSRRLDLPSGGSIVFDQAEALVAIDINSGKTRTSSHDFEEIALKTNMEAVPEIARQIRLRDLGGIIVVDFIDMMKSSNRKGVEQAFRARFSDDRARSKIGRISQFGLLEMTRQRLGPGMSKKVFRPCTACRGAGRQRTDSSRASAILRRLGSAMSLKGFTKVEVRAHPETVQYLQRERRNELNLLEERSGRKLELKEVPDQIEDSVLRYLRADGREVRPGGRRKR
jgi:ribonuclease E